MSETQDKHWHREWRWAGKLNWGSIAISLKADVVFAVVRWRIESKEACLKVTDDTEWKENIRYLWCISVMLGDSNEYYVNNVSVICLHGEQDSFVYSDKSNQECWLIWRMYKQQLHCDDYYNTVTQMHSTAIQSIQSALSVRIWGSAQKHVCGCKQSKQVRMTVCFKKAVRNKTQTVQTT